MCRFCCLVFLVTSTTVFAVSVERHLEPEGRYGNRYGPRQARIEDSEVENVPLVNSRYTPHQGRDQISNVQGEYSPVEEQQRSVPERSSRYDLQQRKPGEDNPSQDSATDAASSYSSVVHHNDPEAQRSSSSPQYQPFREKTNKHYSESFRHTLRETPLSYKPYKNIKQIDQSLHHPTQSLTTATHAPDHLVHVVHPSIMQTLLKQQPQTFDVPPQKDTEKDEQVVPDWRGQSEIQKADQSSRPFKSGFNFQKNSAEDEENVDVSKRPIYVPNRVSVQSPSSDSSFNVGYSIGFGNGIVQPPKVVQPPVSLRHGKVLSYPVSYQNTPVNVHVDGKNSVWKSMGAGIEMSQNIGSPFKNYQPHGFGTFNEQSEYSSGKVINQPIFFREGFDDSYNNSPTSGRHSFDHNHALQQSNSFDFSNAIDPSTNLPYSVETKQSHFFKPEPSYAESFPKQSLPSYIESFPKSSHSSYSESLTKQSRPSFVENQDKQELEPHVQPQGAVTSGERHKYEGPRHERPSFSHNTFGALRSPNSISLHPKPKAIDFSKGLPGNTKPNFAFKPFVSSDLHRINEGIFGNNFGYSGLHVVPHMFASTGKSPPTNMVQAILVPVNTPAPSFSYPVGMPVMGNGYSPYFGQSFGMVGIPELNGGGPTVKNEYDTSDLGNSSPVQFQQHPSSFPKSSMKIVHTHYPAAKHQTNQPEESSPYQFQRTSYTHPQAEEANEHHDSMKFKRLLTTEAPAHARPGMKSNSPSSLHSHPSEGKSDSPSSFHSHPSDVKSNPPSSLYSHPSDVKSNPPSSLYSHASDFVEPTSPPYPVNSHPPRLYRNRPMIIVKRS